MKLCLMCTVWFIKQRSFVGAHEKRLRRRKSAKGVVLRELALFAGAGGGILGGHLLGWRTVCAVEYNTYAASVLLARQNDGMLPAFPDLG